MDQLVEEMHNGVKLFHDGPTHATAFSRDIYTVFPHIVSSPWIVSSLDEFKKE